MHRAGNASTSSVWQTETWSPQTAAGDPELSSLLDACGAQDAALSRVARFVAVRTLELDTTPSGSEISFALRKEGAPYVWPRTFMLRGTNTTTGEGEQRVRNWLSESREEGELRCGAARAGQRGQDEVLALVATHVVADLAPVPTQVRSGEWIDVRAKMLIPSSGSRVTVLGPRGAPHGVPSSTAGREVRARFRAARSGRWAFQVLADTGRGPRPVVEGLVYADQTPPATFREEPAPGEQAGRDVPDAEAALFFMLNAARLDEGVDALARSPELDALARDHAEAMLEAKQIGHDLGGGDPAERIAAAGIRVTLAGENLAHAENPVRAHRALWASPSHRKTLLEARFGAVGVGVARGPNGIWVCQLYARSE